MTGRGGRGGAPIGPLRQRLRRLAHQVSRLLTDQQVKLVAGLQAGGAAGRNRPVGPDDHVDDRVPRESEVADGRPGDRVVGGDRILEHLGTETPDRPALGDRARQRGLARGQPQPPRQALERRALDERRDEHGEEHEVEVLDAAGDMVDHRERGQHDRDRAAQSGPAQQRPLAPAVGETGASRPRPRADVPPARAAARARCP